MTKIILCIFTVFIIKYTNSKDISEAVNIALKDWMFFNRMKILNDRLSSKPNPHPFN